MRHGWDWLGLVDPVKVRVSALKAVLARRGISSELSIERQDLVDLVRSSGELTSQYSLQFKWILLNHAPLRVCHSTVASFISL